MFEELNQKRQAVAENMEDFNIGSMKARNIAAQFGVIEKAKTSDEEVMKARQVGDMHPNGKWVWTEYKPGRFDWRPLKGRGGVDRTPKKGDEGGSAKKEDEGSKKTNISSKTSGADVSKFMDAIKIYSNKYTDESKVTVSKTPKGNWNVSYDGHRLGIINGNMLSDKVAKEKGWIEGSQKKAPTLDDRAKKTDTKTLENAAKSSKAPGSVKGAAEAELKERKNKEIAKKLNLHSKGELATELTRIASEWDSYDDAQKTQTKQAIAQAHSTVLKNITLGNASDESIAALADLTSIQNFFKDSASQPKQVGDIVKDLVADLKAKNSNDTTAGKEKIREIVNKVSALPAGKSIKFSANGREIELKKEKMFDDGTSQFTLYEGGVGRYTSIDAEKTVKNLLDYYPEAKGIKDKITPSSVKKAVESSLNIGKINWREEDGVYVAESGDGGNDKLGNVGIQYDSNSGEITFYDATTGEDLGEPMKANKLDVSNLTSEFNDWKKKLDNISEEDEEE